MTHPTKKLGKRLLATLVAGCAAIGSGFTATAANANSGEFNATTANSPSGTMTATLADGTTYSGRYFQITEETTLDKIEPLWDRWNSEWAGSSGWGYWNAVPSADFIKQYTGWVVANLGAPSGERARCKFHLVRPAEGIAGGGIGQCQSPDGLTVDATFSSA